MTESEPGYGQLFAVLLRRRLWMLGALGAAVGIAFVMTKLQQPTYVSSLQLLVEPIYQGKQGQGQEQNLDDQFADSNVQIDSGTQISLMTSSGLLRKAMVSLNREYPEIDPEDSDSLAAFKSSLSVTQVTFTGVKEKGATKIFQVTYTDNDPVKTKSVLETMQKVYQDYNLEQQKNRLAKGLAFIDQQLPQIENKVKQFEDSLEQFRTDQELIDPQVQAQAQAEALNRIQDELRTNSAQIEELQDRFTSLQAQVGLAPEEAVIAARLNQSLRYQTLLNEIQKTELELVQQRLLFNDNTAEVQVLLDKRQEQVGLLQDEVSQVVGDSGDGTAIQLGQLDLTLINNLVDAEVNLRALEARDSSLVNSEQQLRAELQRFPELLAEYGRLQPEIELNRDTLKQLLAARQELGLAIAQGGFDWQVVEEPQLGLKTGPSLARNLLLGAVVGLMLGGVAAFLREASDDVIHDAEDLRRQSGLPLLGMLPQFSIKAEARLPIALPFSRTEKSTLPSDQVVYWAPFREACDLLYKNIQLLDSSRSLKSLVVTSVLPGEGKSTLALGLAISAARLHQRVLLIDANLRSPHLHELLNLSNEQGLSTLLASHASIPKHIGSQGAETSSNVSVLTAGSAPDDPVMLLSSQRMRDAIAVFEQSYDLVIIDAPSVSGKVDPILLGSCCDGILLVERVDQVTRSRMSQAIAMLSKLNIIGVVANGLEDFSNSHSSQSLPFQTALSQGSSNH
ncbi:MAG: polysaccharide biosynthesis tyrosine autokinase [Drouetiella hepatica Uher 2000/2452]|uniref:Polysaccharide biosynthesis tyrosine autokinase n=1 Tax=Drouetiella hepatica Uher 2000/2452 TaxID=904376 RepID=A0A951Q9R9_9CYAN|nr:polysaccharide biosynthesis tyrosine autokinase [Drouetiella hepatica Uher 2000/2452]